MDRLRLLLPLAWRNLWRNPRRTIITLIVVSAGVWSILAFAAISRAWAESSRDTTLKLMTGEGQIHATGYLDDPTVDHRLAPPEGALARVLGGPLVTVYAPRVRISAIVQSEYKSLPMTFVGVSPDAERRLSVLPAQITQGRYLKSADDGGIVIGRNLAKRLKTRVGKRVVVMAQDASGKSQERAFVVVGLFGSTQQAEDEFGFTGLKTAQSFTGIGNDISEIAFDAVDDKALPALIADLEAAAPRLDVQSWKTLAPLAAAVSSFFEAFVYMWLLVVFILVAFGIVNTQLMAVFERTREFGLLQALGMRPRLVLLDVAIESVFLIGLGVLCGVGLGLATIEAFPHGLDLGFLARGAEVFGAGRILHLRFNAHDFIVYSLIVWVLGVVATLWPARQASRVSPVEAMGRT